MNLFQTIFKFACLKSLALLSYLLFCKCIHIWIEIKEEKSNHLAINVIDNAPSFIENINSSISQVFSMATKIIQERLEIINEEAGIDSCKFGFERILYIGYLASKSWLTLPIKLKNERIDF